MPLLRRLLYYLGGFTVGLILLFFFLGGKKASCEYGPNARTLKNIRVKEHVFTNEFEQQLQGLAIDTAAVSHILNEGDVLFSESNTDLDSCKIYVIEGLYLEKEMKLSVENCDSVAKFFKLEPLN